MAAKVTTTRSSTTAAAKKAAEAEAAPEVKAEVERLAGRQGSGKDRCQEDDRDRQEGNSR